MKKRGSEDPPLQKQDEDYVHCVSALSNNLGTSKDFIIQEIAVLSALIWQQPIVTLN
jgi:hypothetical protein